MASSDDELVVVSTKEEPLSDKELQFKLLHNLVNLDEPCPFFETAFERFVAKKFKNYYSPDVISAVFKRIHHARVLKKPAPLFNPIEPPSIVISDSDDSSSETDKVCRSNYVDLTSLDCGRPSTSLVNPTNVKIEVTNSRIDSLHVTVNNNVQTKALGENVKPVRSRKRKSEPIQTSRKRTPVKRTRNSTGTKRVTQKEADVIRTSLLISKIVELSVESEYHEQPKIWRSKQEKRFQ